MKTILNYLRYIPKKIAGLFALVAVVALPFATTGASPVRIEGNIGVANVTQGDATYGDSVNAKVDEVVKIQVWYHNMENPNSGLNAENLKVGINLPTAAGSTQTVTTTISSDNSNTVTDSAQVNLSLDRAQLEYVPGSAKWRYNKAAYDGNTACQTGVNQAADSCYETVAISDNVVKGGVVLENARPCFAYEATVTILARVKAPVVSITKNVREKQEGPGNWATDVNVSPGETVQYRIRVKNEGNTRLDDVVVGDNLPKYVSYVEGSTKLYNGNNPNGTTIHNNNVTRGGINIGSYNPGAVAYVLFEAKIDPINVFEKCGTYRVINEALVKSDELGPYYNTAYTTIEVKCQPSEQPRTSFNCEDLSAKKISRMKYEFTAKSKVQNTTVKGYTFHFGDGEHETVTTNKTSFTVEYTYKKLGTYEAYVLVDTAAGKTQRIDACEVTVKVSDKPGEPEEPETPTELPNTGPAAVAMSFFGTGGAAYAATSFRRSRKELLDALLRK